MHINKWMGEGINQDMEEIEVREARVPTGESRIEGNKTTPCGFLGVVHTLVCTHCFDRQQSRQDQSQARRDKRNRPQTGTHLQ